MKNNNNKIYTINVCKYDTARSGDFKEETYILDNNDLNIACGQFGEAMIQYLGVVDVYVNAHDCEGSSKCKHVRASSMNSDVKVVEDKDSCTITIDNLNNIDVHVVFAIVNDYDEKVECEYVYTTTFSY